MTEHVDLLIVGAGWHGIIMAKTHKEIHPDSKFILIDSAATVGGVWAKERLYPGLKTNNVIGSFEFSDFPMIPEQYGLRLGQHIPGEVVHAYLRAAVDRFGLTAHLRLATNIETAELQEDGSWLVSNSPVSLGHNGTAALPHQIRAKKLVLATGLSSEPAFPTFLGQNSFTGNILHSKQLREKANILANSKKVVVLGGNKSSWDVCYGTAKAGAEVHMVIRPSGGGPSYVWPTSWFGLLRTSPARLSSFRYLSVFDPCTWGGQDGSSFMRTLLHQTWLGRLIARIFWAFLGFLVQTVYRYDSHPGTKLLKPWTSPYWTGISLSVHNYETSWFELARLGKIHVHVADIVSLSKHSVHLSDGTAIEADTLVCCTGWKAVPPIKFIPTDLPPKLGFPGPCNEEDISVFADLKKQIVNQRPELARKPREPRPEASKAVTRQVEETLSTPYQLYRFMVPTQAPFVTHRRNIAFIGCQLAALTVAVAQAQALWITAFFDDKIYHLRSDRLNLEAIKQYTLYLAEYERIRHPPEAGGAGAKYPDMVFDCIPYIDVLLADLGMKFLRKQGKGTWWREWFERYTMKDYQGLVEEWIDLQGVKGHDHNCKDR